MVDTFSPAVSTTETNSYHTPPVIPSLHFMNRFILPATEEEIHHEYMPLHAQAEREL